MPSILTSLIYQLQNATSREEQQAIYDAAMGNLLPMNEFSTLNPAAQTAAISELGSLEGEPSSFYGDFYDSDFDDGVDLVANDDYIVKPKTQFTWLLPLANDSIHTSENFEHTTTLNFSGNSGWYSAIEETVGLPTQIVNWPKYFSGSSTFTTFETDSHTGMSTVSFTNFEFQVPNTEGRYYYLEEIFHVNITSSLAVYRGGTVTITSAYGSISIPNIQLVFGFDNIRESPEFGRGVAVIQDFAANGFDTGQVLQMPLGDFDALNTPSGGAPSIKSPITVNMERGLLNFNALPSQFQPPKLILTQGGSDGLVIPLPNRFGYIPYYGAAIGSELLQYKIITPLGNFEIAEIYIGTIDLDISPPNGLVLDEYFIEDIPGLYLGLNNDDDNTNHVVDTLEDGFADDDLVELSIVDLLPAGPLTNESYVLISYDSSKVKVWHEQDKTTPSSRPDGYWAPLDAADKIFLQGASADDLTLWIEGVGEGSTAIKVHWLLTTPTNGYSVSTTGYILDQVTVNVLPAVVLTIPENSPIGTFVGNYNVVSGATYSTFGSAPFFSSDPTGNVFVAMELNYEAKKVFSFSVVGYTPHSNFVFHVTVNITDVNEGPEYVGSTSLGTARLQEVGFLFVDPEQDPITSVVGIPNHGVFRLNPEMPAGTLMSNEHAYWVPRAEDFLGASPAAGDSFTITASDGSAMGNPTNVNISVTGSQDIFGSYRLVDPTVPGSNEPANKKLVDTDPGASGDVSKIDDPDYGWQSATPTDPDMLLYAAALAGNLVGFEEWASSPEASQALMIFLSNPPPDTLVALDVRRILAMEPLARHLWENSLQKLIETIDSKAFVGTVSLVQKEAELGNTSGNYKFAVGQFTGWANATVTGSIISNSIVYEVTFRYNMWDPYDWAPSGHGYGPWQFAKFHRQGLSRQYLTEGDHAISFSWTKGSPPIILPSPDQ